MCVCVLCECVHVCVCVNIYECVCVSVCAGVCVLSLARHSSYRDASSRLTQLFNVQL